MANFYKYTVNSLTDYLKKSKIKSSILYIELLSPIRSDLSKKKLDWINFNFKKSEFIKNFIFEFIKNYLSFFYFLIKLLSKNILNLDFSSIDFYKLSKKNKIAYLTVIDDISQLNNTYDSYFGARRNSKDHLFIITNRTGLKTKNVIKNIKDNKISNTVFIDSEGDINTYLFSYMYGFFLHIYYLIKWIKSPKKRINLFLSLDTISKKSINNLIYSIQVKKILSKLKIKSLVTTWEGYPWERILCNFCWMNNINYYGYVHVGPSKIQHSAFRFLGKEYEPRKLLSPNVVSKNLIKKLYKKDSIVVGSHKSNLINENFSKVNKIDFTIKETLYSKTLLIIPQGNFYEVKILFNLALDILEKDINIILRFHPLLLKYKEINLFINEEIKKNKYGSNIILSKTTLVNDIKSSTHFLYCGSSAAIECLSYGLTPIYFNCGYGLDSLLGYEIPNKFCAKSPGDLKKILNIRIKSDYNHKAYINNKNPFNLNFSEEFNLS